MNKTTGNLILLLFAQNQDQMSFAVQKGMETLIKRKVIYKNDQGTWTIKQKAEKRIKKKFGIQFTEEIQE